MKFYFFLKKPRQYFCSGLIFGDETVGRKVVPDLYLNHSDQRNQTAHYLVENEIPTRIFLANDDGNRHDQESPQVECQRG